MDRKGNLSFEEMTELCRNRNLSGYYIIPLALDDARTNVLLPAAGGVLQIIKEENDVTTAKCEISFNDIGNNLPFSVGTRIVTPFTKIWITNTAQTGKKLYLAISTEFDNIFRYDYNVPVSVTATIESANIKDSAGNDLTSTGNALDVNLKTSSITLPVSDALVSAALIVKTADFTAGQTAQTIWTPAGGKKFVICDMILSASAAGAITVFDNTDNTTLRVFKANLAANGGLCKSYRKPYISATADNVLKYTTGAGIAGSITVSGYEV